MDIGNVGNAVQKNKLKFLVVGHAKTGTTHAANIFQTYNVDVRHEIVGRCGISSWMFAVNSDSVPFGFEGKNKYEFEKVIHLVRNPIDAISSIFYKENKSEKSLKWRKKWINIYGNEYEQAVSSFLGWNKLIKASGNISYLVKIEESEERIKEILIKEGLISPKTKTCRIKKSNRSNHPIISWDKLRSEINAELFKELLNFCEQYNYPTA